MPRPTDILELTVAELQATVRKARRAGYRRGEATATQFLKAVSKLNGSAAPLMKGLGVAGKPNADDSEHWEQREQEAAPDPHAALSAALVDALIEAHDAGREADVPGLVAAYQEHLDDPGVMSASLSGSASLAKAIPAVWLFKAGKYDESKHPRDDRGRYVSKDAIHAAAADPAKAAELRAKVTDPKQREKLDAAIADPETVGRTKRGQQKHEAGQRREKRAADHARAGELAEKIASGAGDLNDMRELGQHLEGLTVDKLRVIQARIATKGGGRRKAEMVAALKDGLYRLAQERAPNARPEADHARLALAGFQPNRYKGVTDGGEEIAAGAGYQRFEDGRTATYTPEQAARIAAGVTPEEAANRIAEHERGAALESNDPYARDRHAELAAQLREHHGAVFGGANGEQGERRQEAPVGGDRSGQAVGDAGANGRLPADPRAEEVSTTQATQNGRAGLKGDPAGASAPAEIDNEPATGVSQDGRSPFPTEPPGGVSPADRADAARQLGNERDLERVAADDAGARVAAEANHDDLADRRERMEGWARDKPGSQAAQGAAGRAAAAMAPGEAGHPVPGRHYVRLPKDKKRLTTQQAVVALQEMGYSQGEAVTKKVGKTLVQLVPLTRPDGTTSLVTHDEIKHLVYDGAAVETGTRGEPKAAPDLATPAPVVAPAAPSPKPADLGLKDDHEDIARQLAARDVNGLRKRMRLPAGTPDADVYEAALRAYPVRGGDPGWLAAEHFGFSDDPAKPHETLRMIHRHLAGNPLASDPAMKQPEKSASPTKTKPPSLGAGATPAPRKRFPGEADDTDHFHKPAPVAPAAGPKPPLPGTRPPEPKPAEAPKQPAPVAANGLPAVAPGAAQKPDDPAYVAAGKALLADDGFRKDLADAWNHQRLFVEHRDGLIPLDRVYHELVKRRPGVTLDQFHAAADQLSRDRAAELHVLNETKAVPANERLASIARNDRLYHFMRFPGGADAEKMRPAGANPGDSTGIASTGLDKRNGSGDTTPVPATPAGGGGKTMTATEPTPADRANDAKAARNARHAAAVPAAGVFASDNQAEFYADTRRKATTAPASAWNLNHAQTAAGDLLNWYLANHIPAPADRAGASAAIDLMKTPKDWARKDAAAAKPVWDRFWAVAGKNGDNLKAAFDARRAELPDADKRATYADPAAFEEFVLRPVFGLTGGK